jgi:DNA (cytosine-5)-methyltransferase 1
MITHGSLFTGAGGFDIAAQELGWNNTFQVEINEFANINLQKNFTDVNKYSDIKQFSGNDWAGAIDVISGGFPCQPFSLAGNKQGKNDNRFLWPEMYRVIREVSPVYVVAENVPGLLTNEGGVVFEQIYFQLEAAGYEVLPFNIPALAKNANHRRERIWIVAYSANAHRQRLSKTPFHNGSTFTGKSKTVKELTTLEFIETYGRRAEPGAGGVVDGLPITLDENRIHLMGNAIVWQIAHEIFKVIDSHLKQ